MRRPSRGAGSRRLALARRLLPPALRARYAEQWAADLRDAAELDLPPTSIAWGALRFAALARLGPHGAEPEELERQSWQLARWGGALIGTAVIGSTAGFVGFGGLSGVAQVAGVHPALVAIVLAPVLLVLASAALGIALLWAAVLRRPRTHPMSALIVVALTAGAGLVASWPLAIERGDGIAGPVLASGLLLLIVGTIGALVIWGVTPVDARRASPRATALPHVRSGIVLLAASLALLGVITLGLFEGLIWGPEDQAGGMPAAAVYAALSDLDRAAGIAWVIAWAVLASLGPLALVIVRHLMLVAGRTDRDVARLTGVLGLLAVGGVVFFQGWATFSIGMSIADTLPPFAGGRSAVWSLYAAAGATAGLIGVLLALAPAPGEPGPARADMTVAAFS